MRKRIRFAGFGGDAHILGPNSAAEEEAERIGRHASMERWRGVFVGLGIEAETIMKTIIGCAIVVLALAAAVPADAKGCLRGAVAGAVAGHYAGHHAVMGAAAGCVIGRHEANKRARMQRNDETEPH